MPEIINSKKVFSLIEVTLSIQKTIAERYKSSFWVKAEMNKLNHYSHSGHCYPELIEKREGKVIAQVKSNLWKSDFERINANFLTVLKEPIKDGIKILFCATINFDPSHGLSLRIIDIDPSFSLGELEREKLATIERLKREGIYNSNKALKLPLLPQRIAVISVETSKGYSDFLKVIQHSPWGYKFFHFLFPSLLQGEKSIPAIISQLKRVRKVIHHFDTVAIIRGGGGDVGLSSYNSYELASEIARFPIPVITGIGHSTNETVSEMIAFKNAITPTELADFLIQRFHNFAIPVKKAEELIADKASRMLSEEKIRLRNAVKYFQSVTFNKLLRSHHDLANQSTSFLQHSKFYFKQQREFFHLILASIKKNAALSVADDKQKLASEVEALSKNFISYLDKQKTGLISIEKNVNNLDPINVLKRGFSITLCNGKAVRSYNDVKPGVMITTTLMDGQLTSDVTSSKSE